MASDGHVWLVAVPISRAGFVQNVVFFDRLNPQDNLQHVEENCLKIRDGEQTAEEWAEISGIPVLCSHPEEGSIIRADTLAHATAMKLRWG